VGSARVLVHNSILCAPVYLRNQPLPNLTQPAYKYQQLVTGKAYEEVWNLPSLGRDVHVDAINDNWIVEPKWMNASDDQFKKSPYYPGKTGYDEAKIIDQMQRQLVFASEKGLNGVRWVVSNSAAQKYYEAFFRSQLPEAYRSGFIQVWHVPGNGM
jgi:hypothetical protein